MVIVSITLSEVVMLLTCSREPSLASSTLTLIFNRRQQILPNRTRYMKCVFIEFITAIHHHFCRFFHWVLFPSIRHWIYRSQLLLQRWGIIELITRGSFPSNNLLIMITLNLPTACFCSIAIYMSGWIYSSSYHAGI